MYLGRISPQNVLPTFIRMSCSLAKVKVLHFCAEELFDTRRKAVGAPQEGRLRVVWGKLEPRHNATTERVSERQRESERDRERE